MTSVYQQNPQNQLPSDPGVLSGTNPSFGGNNFQQKQSVSEIQRFLGKKYLMVNRVADNSSEEIFTCFHNQSKKKLIARCLKISRIDGSKRHAIKQRILSFLNYQNPHTPLYDCIRVSKTAICMVLSYKQGNFLKDYLYANEGNGAYSEDNIRLWMVSLLLSLNDIHSKGGYHGNIKFE